MSEPEIDWIKRIDLHAGDTLVVRLNGYISRDVAEKFKEVLQGQIPDGAKVLVVDANVADLTVLHAA